ncbi:MAG: glutamine--fructose-6-phosphate transaminase (isomerizing) [Candidatus Daviesbacteria bacterium]|nr:glutamine--fructose-6-phosphate transaminase (isomerizing) [Candidatus Daviesbacteria bacterium]
MCGIFAVIGTSNNAPQLTFKGLSDIEYRGYDSWGICFSSDDLFKTIKNIGFLPKTFPEQLSQVSLGHTRWATHGGVTIANAHPHSDCNNELILVHNGIIENYLELKAGLRKHLLKSETDSEIAIHLIEDEYSKSKDLSSSVSKVFSKFDGLNAIVVTNGTKIVACKKGSPLVLGKLTDGYCLASDPNALLPLTDKLIFIEDNQMVVLNDKLTISDLKTKKEIQVKFTKVIWDYASSTLQNYEYFMEKEINEQPKVIETILNNSAVAEKIAKEIKSAFGTYFIGCGTAAYACLAGTYLFSKFAKKHVNFSIGSEFNYIEDYLTPKSLVVAVSQSGETIDTIEPVNAAKAKKCKIVAMTNTLGSTLYRTADYKLLLNAGVEKAVASTKAFIAMLSEMILLTFMVAGKKQAGVEVLKKSALEIKNILKNANLLDELVNKIAKQEHIFCLGRGLSYPVALESALKIKETTYIHAEGYAAGELKHGPLALITKGTPVIVYVPNDETRDSILANAKEVQARGAYVIGVGPDNNPVFDFFFKVKDCGASSVIPHTVFAQVLAYKLALKKGLNPDKPRNLAKSVVVR